MSSLSIAPSFVPVRPAPQVRLTRRGRLVVFVASVLLVFAGAFLLAGGAMGTDQAGTPTPTSTYVVGDGDTLGGIAREFGTSVSELEQLNRLDSASILAGQRLRVPTAG